jgi:hypothetical protein
LSEFDKYDPNFVSKAQVEIKRIAFSGTVNGGASKCIDVPGGWFAPALSVYPSQCPTGQEPNPSKSGCVPCSDGFFNPSEGGYCKKCPEFTYSDGTSCEAFD